MDTLLEVARNLEKLQETAEARRASRDVTAKIRALSAAEKKPAGGRKT